MSTNGSRPSAGDSFQTPGISIKRVGRSIKISRTDVAGGSIHIPIEEAEDVSAAIRTLADE